MHNKIIFIIALLSLLPALIACDVKGTADQRYNLGIGYAVEGKFEKAKDEFHKALKLDNSYQPAKESLNIINEALNKKLKNDAIIYFFKGIQYSNERKFNEVISSLSHSISMEPTFSSAYYERGLAHANKGEYDSAISDFSKTIELSPKDAAAFNNRGLAYARGKKKYDEAFSDFNKAIKINPKFAEAYDNRGIAYRIKYDDKEKACTDWEKACELGKCDNYNLARQNSYCR